MQPLYLLIGVPGSGKTWVALQLADKFNYLENDHFIGADYGAELIKQTRKSERPILATCPFGERDLRERLIRNDVNVIPVFIVECGQTVKKRYEEREKRPIPTQFITRAMSIKKRALEWDAKYGTSLEVLEILKEAADAARD